MGKRGEYRPPNGGGSVRDAALLSMFDDPDIAWPKRSHWWHYVDENEVFAMWLMNVAAGSHTTAIEQARTLARFLDIMVRGISGVRLIIILRPLRVGFVIMILS